MKSVTAVLALLIGFGAPAVSFGAVTVYADIEGTDKSGTDYVDISGTYTNGCMNYTIAPYSTSGSSPNNLARIEAVDGDPETLWLRNVKITANNDCVDSGHIYFYAVFNGPPDTVASPVKKVSIERWASGTFAPAVFGSWITVDGWAQHNPVNPSPPDGVSGTWEQIRQSDSFAVTCSTCGTFTNLAKVRIWDPAQQQTFTGSRVLKGELWFKLENSGNKLQFTNDVSKGLRIKSVTATGGEGPE